MQKLLLLSVVIATVGLPAWAASDRSARRGLKRVVLTFVLFDVLYMLMLRFIYPRLF